MEGPAEGVPPNAGGPAADVLRMVVELLEADEPRVEEALRVAKGGLKLLELQSAAEALAAAPAPAPDAYTGPPHDRKLLVRVHDVCEVDVAGAFFLVLKLGANELRTAQVKDLEPRFDSQLFQFPLHSLAAERGSSETLRVELYQKKKIGVELVGSLALDFGAACVGTREPPFQPLLGCAEAEPARWSADADQLPGRLSCTGLVEVPPPEFAESCRDFTRAFAATASGSGDMLLLGPREVQDHNTMKPIKSEMRSSGDVSQEVNTAAVKEFEGIISASIHVAGIQISDDALQSLSRRLIGHLTVSPAMQVLLDFGVSPAVYQNKFVVLTGKGGVRVATYGYIGDNPEGDRPDRKHTGVVLRMLTGDLVSSGTADGTDATESADSVTFSCKLTTFELMDDIIAEDLPLMIEAVTTGSFEPFAAPAPLPEKWFQDTFYRLENETSDSTGAVRLTLTVTADESVPAKALELQADEDARQAAEALLQSLAATEDANDQTDLTQRRDHAGYAVPAIVSPCDWRHIRARALRAEEIAIGRWFEYLKHTPRILPLEIRTEWDTATGKEVHKPVVTAQLRRLISCGIPSQWACGEHTSMTQSCMEMGAELLAMIRPRLWLELTGAKDLKLSSKIDYHSMSSCTSGSAAVEDWLELAGAASAYEAMDRSRKQIERDLPRTSPDMTTEEEEELRRVLLTFVLKYPSVGYCQSMNFIALALIRSCHGEENAFWLLGAVSTVCLPNYYSETMTGTQVDMQLVGKLVEMKLPAIHEHLASLEVPLEILISQWLLPIYVTTFPSTTAFAIWDWLFIDGPDVLLLVAIAFMSLHEVAILECDDFGGVVTLFAELPMSQFAPHRLLKAARAFQDELGSKLDKLRGETTATVTSSGEEQNKERLVRQMVKETHLTEEDVNQLHERFMQLEAAKSRKQRQSEPEVTPGASGEQTPKGTDKKKQRQKRGSVVGRRRRGSVLQSFKKTELVEETVYEERGIAFEGFKELLETELPQWAAASDEEQLKHLFHAFDTDSTGKISVAQFIQGVATFTGTDLDKRLQMIFRTADIDHSGYVSREEMLKLFIDSYNMFFPGMNTASIPELVSSIFERLEVNPAADAGLNFDEFALVVKSQPLLLECFSQQALDARQREDAASAERAVALHGLENYASKLNTKISSDGKKAKWKEQYFVLQEGVLSVFDSQKSHEKGKRLQRIDLKGGDVHVELLRDGGGKSGLEECLLLSWPEQGQQRELRVSEPTSYSYNFEKGLKDAEKLYHWAQVLSLFSASHDRATTSSMTEMPTLCAMPESILEQLVRALVMDMRIVPASRVETPTSRNLADEAATLALAEGLPTVSSDRYDAIKNCCKQVLSTGGEQASILAMVRRGVAIDQLEEQLLPLGLQPSQARVFYDVLSDTARMERAAAFQEHEDGTVMANGEGLAAVPIFSACAAHVRHDVAAAFVCDKIDGGNWIFHQGDTGDAMYCVVKGDVAVVKEPTAENEEEKVLAVLSAGHCFGEMSLLSSETRSAGMRCLGDTLVMRLDIDSFTTLTQMYPELRTEMTKVAAERAAFGASKATRQKLSTRSTRAPGAGGAGVAVATPRAPHATASRPTDPALTTEEAQELLAEAEALEQQLERAVEACDYDTVRRLNEQIEVLSPRRKTAAAVAGKGK